MRFKPGNIKEHLSAVPMAVAVAPLAVGIAVSAVADAPAWVWIVLCAVSLAAAMALYGKHRHGVCAALALALAALGAALYDIRTVEGVPYDTPVEVELRAMEPSRQTATRSRTPMRITACAEYGHLVRSQVMVWSDPAVRLHEGERLRARVRIRPFTLPKQADTTAGFDHEKYFRLLRHRGFIGNATLARSAVKGYLPAGRQSLHGVAVERLKRLLPEGERRAVLLSMAVGERGEVGKHLRSAYSASGTAHLLAVSGLHVGIVFTLLNALLWFVPLIRRGNLWRSATVVAAIWIYVVVCGSPPSAVRAAVMFSLLQLSMFSTSDYVPLNTLGATAFAMLLFDPFLLYDVGFRLSFLAVAGILLWGVPLYRALRCRYRIVNSVVATVAVGITATLATFPVTSHDFGIISLIGIALNPAVIALANLTLFAAFFALTLSVTLLADGAARIAATLAGWQNAIVEMAAEVPFGHLDVRLSEGTVSAIYGVFALLTLALWAMERKKSQ